MATTNASSGAAALRYATALIDTAIEGKALDSVERDLSVLESMIAGSEDFKTLLTSPLFKRADQRKAVTALAEKAKFHALVRNFLALLADNRRLPLLGAVIGAVKTDMARRRGEVNARVQAAYALSAAQTKALQKAISDSVGRNVTLDVEIDEALIGGMVVTVGSQMIDDSVRRKLERLNQIMKSGANQNAAEKEKAS